MISRYNTTVIKLLGSCADNPKFFDELNAAWFKISGDAYYAYLLTKQCIIDNRLLNDVSLTKTVQEHPELKERAMSEFGNKSINNKAVEDNLELAVCDVLRLDVNRVRVNYENLRGILRKDYINLKSTKSLQKAIHDIETGKDAEYVMSNLFNPASEIEFVETTSFKERMQSIIDEHYEEPIYTGIEQLDSKGGLEKGKILTLGGDSGNLKTRFSIWLCLMILQKNPDFKIVYFEKETQARDVYYILLSFILNQSVSTIKGSGKDFLQSYLGTLKDEHLVLVNRFIVVDYNDFDSIEEMAHIVGSVEPDAWVLDFVGMYAQGDSVDKATMKMNNVLNKIKELVHKSNTLGIVLSQLKKDSTANRRHKLPQRNDLEWSGKLYQYSEWVCLNFFPYYYHSDIITKNSEPSRYFYVIFTKWRNEPNDTLCFKAFPETAKFFEPDSTQKSYMASWLKEYREKN